MTRRDLLRRSAVGGATLAGVSAGALRLDHGPVGNSQAIAPLAAAGAVAAGTSVGLNAGWALREVDPLGIVDDPEDGISGDALENEIYNATQARKSNNQSTFIDNQTILESIDHTAWADGKLAAIESLNNQDSQDDVETAAHEATYDHESIVKKNVIRSWNESAKEFVTLFRAAQDHEEVDQHSVFDAGDTAAYDPIDYLFLDELDENQVELPDGTEIEELTIEIERDGDDYEGSIGPVNGNKESNSVDLFVTVNVPDQSSFVYNDESDWGGLYDDITQLFDDVRDGLTEWVDGVYGEVQSGELDTDELLTPREQAELTSEDEDFPQAIADLQALNISVDLEREAEIYLPEVEATVWGQLGYSGEDTLETGEIDPDDKAGTIYLTYDISQGQGEWSAHEEGIDGGTLTFTAEPFQETLYVVDTAAGETVELTEDDFEEDDDGEEWTVDLSDDLDDAITNVEQIEFFSEVSETQYETIQLQDEFEIIDFTDSDGESYEESNFERSEPHTDDNYITEEEWQDQQERHEELIQQYEDAQGSGISIPGVDDVLDGEANGLIGIAVVGMVFVFGILSALNPLS